MLNIVPGITAFVNVCSSVDAVLSREQGSMRWNYLLAEVSRVLGSLEMECDQENSLQLFQLLDPRVQGDYRTTFVVAWSAEH